MQSNTLTSPLNIGRKLDSCLDCSICVWNKCTSL